MDQMDVIPDPEQRLQLWREGFSSTQLEPGPGVDLSHIADEYELSGGAVANVVRYAALMALRRGSRTSSLDDIRQGIRREMRKDGIAD